MHIKKLLINFNNQWELHRIHFVEFSNPMRIYFWAFWTRVNNQHRSEIPLKNSMDVEPNSGVRKIKWAVEVQEHSFLIKRKAFILKTRYIIIETSARLGKLFSKYYNRPDCFWTTAFHNYSIESASEIINHFNNLKILCIIALTE